MNQVEIPLKLTGIGAIKKELRDLKGQIANATDPEQMTQLAQRAGELADQLKDANEQVAIFNSGSRFEAASNAFGMIKQDLMSLDFEGAAQKAKIFQTAMAGISGKDISGAFKGLISMVKTLGQTFVRFGIMLLTNPIFLLVTVITAIVAAVVIFLNKIGILKKVLEVLMMPINALIEGFKMLTDWMGLTNHAGQKAAEDEKKRNEDRLKQMEKLREEQKRNFEAEQNEFDRKIKLMAAEGKSTEELSKQKIQASIDYQKQLVAEQQSIVDNQWRVEDMLRRNGLMRLAGNKLTELTEEANNNLYQSQQNLLNAENDLAVAEAESAKKAKENAKKKADAYKEYAKLRLEIARQIQDLEASQLKDETERALLENQYKYARLIEDTKKNAKLTQDEKTKLTKLYGQIQLEEDKKIQDKAKQQLKDHNQEMIDLLDERLKAQKEKQKEDRERFFESQAQAASLVVELQKTSYQKEQDALTDQLNQRLALVKGNAHQEAIVRAEYAKQSTLLEIAEAEKRRDAILNLATTTNEGLNQLGQIFINDQKKLEQFQKATALIQIGIDTAKAISSLVAAAQANPFNGVSAGAAGIAQFASGIVQILTNMAKAKQLLTNPTSTPNAGGGGLAGGGAATATAQATPAVNLFGQGNQLNQVGAPTSVEANQNITVQAVVSETDVTSTQTKIDKIKKNAEL